MKYQVLFYQKNNEKYPRLWSAAVVIGAFLALYGLKLCFMYSCCLSSSNVYSSSTVMLLNSSTLVHDNL